MGAGQSGVLRSPRGVSHSPSYVWRARPVQREGAHGYDYATPFAQHGHTSYRALSEAAKSVAELADEAARRAERASQRSTSRRTVRRRPKRATATPGRNLTSEDDEDTEEGDAPQEMTDSITSLMSERSTTSDMSSTSRLSGRDWSRPGRFERLAEEGAEYAEDDAEDLEGAIKASRTPGRAPPSPDSTRRGRDMTRTAGKLGTLFEPSPPLETSSSGSGTCTPRMNPQQSQESAVIRDGDGYARDAAATITAEDGGAEMRAGPGYGLNYVPLPLTRSSSTAVVQGLEQQGATSSRPQHKRGKSLTALARSPGAARRGAGIVFLSVWCLIGLRGWSGQDKSHGKLDGLGTTSVADTGWGWKGADAAAEHGTVLGVGLEGLQFAHAHPRHQHHGHLYPFQPVDQYSYPHLLASLRHPAALYAFAAPDVPSLRISFSNSSSSNFATRKDTPPSPPPAPTPPPPEGEQHTWERLFGRASSWTCTVLYMTSRLPQIWTNHIRRSVAGLSVLLFAAAFAGNALYTISILANPRAVGEGSSAYLKESTPFLLGSGGTLIFDLVIMAQTWAFRVPERTSEMPKISAPPVPRAYPNAAAPDSLAYPSSQIQSPTRFPSHAQAHAQAHTGSQPRPRVRNRTTSSTTSTSAFRLASAPKPTGSEMNRAPSYSNANANANRPLRSAAAKHNTEPEGGSTGLGIGLSSPAAPAGGQSFG